jgi:hypothetical protein
MPTSSLRYAHRQSASVPIEHAREPILHELKCWPQFFDAIARGCKRHDLRRANDRDFRVGDRLLLREFDPESGGYTGREQIVAVTYITSSKQPCALSEESLNPNFCILSIAHIPPN